RSIPMFSLTDTAAPGIYTLSLHDALPISLPRGGRDAAELLELEGHLAAGAATAAGGAHLGADGGRPQDVRLRQAPHVVVVDVGAQVVGAGVVRGMRLDRTGPMVRGQLQLVPGGDQTGTRAAGPAEDVGEGQAHQAASFRWVWVWLPGLPPHLAHVHTAGGGGGVAAVMRHSSWRCGPVGGGPRSRPPEVGWWPSGGRTRGTRSRGRSSHHAAVQRPAQPVGGSSSGRSRSWRSRLRHVDESGIVALESDSDRRRRAVAVLRDDQVRLASPWGLLVVGVLPVEEDHNVGVLLERSRRAQVGHLRLLVLPLLRP